MHDIEIKALINPFSLKIERREWDSEQYHSSYDMRDGHVTSEHTVELRLGAALVQDGEDGPYIHISPTIPVPAEVASEIIGYVVKSQTPIERAPYGRYELNTAVGMVSEATYSRDTRIDIKVHGADREDVMALLSAIAAGNEKPVVLWDGTAPSKALVAASAEKVENGSAQNFVRNTDLPSGHEDPMVAVRDTAHRFS